MEENLQKIRAEQPNNSLKPKKEEEGEEARIERKEEKREWDQEQRDIGSTHTYTHIPRQRRAGQP
jgi:hypothetical protein